VDLTEQKVLNLPALFRPSGFLIVFISPHCLPPVFLPPWHLSTLLRGTSNLVLLPKLFKKKLGSVLHFFLCFSSYKLQLSSRQLSGSSIIVASLLTLIFKYYWLFSCRPKQILEGSFTVLNFSKFTNCLSRIKFNLNIGSVEGTWHFLIIASDLSSWAFWNAGGTCKSWMTCLNVEPDSKCFLS